MTATLALENTKIGDWLLLRRLPGSAFLCRCICGIEKTVKLSNMRSGRSLGCGCVGHSVSAAARRLHGATNGYTKSREYRAWSDMHTRCANPSRETYKYYGAKGIKVCEQWDDYRVFLADMGPCPPRHSLDRINPSLGYAADNCRWSVAGVQTFNRKLPKSASGHRGVYLRGGYFCVLIGVKNRAIRVGTYCTIEEAIAARKKAEIEHYGFLAPE